MDTLTTQKAQSSSATNDLSYKERALSIIHTYSVTRQTSALNVYLSRVLRISEDASSNILRELEMEKLVSMKENDLGIRYGRLTPDGKKARTLLRKRAAKT